MSTLYCCKGALNDGRGHKSVYRYESEYRDKIYKIWEEDMGWRLEIWNYDYSSYQYIHVPCIKNLLQYIPVVLHLSNDWTLYGWYP